MSTSASDQTTPWLEVLRDSVPLGRVRYALFDFDGTLSTIRRGWEQVMAPLMVESICGDGPPDPTIAAEVADFIQQSTGTLTIRQMMWLADTVRRYGRNATVLSAGEYKRIYNQRLLAAIQHRLNSLDNGGAYADHSRLMIAGARDFLTALARRGVALYFASGTDQEYVCKEAAALGLAGFFGAEIHGAAGDSLDESKERVIARILADRGLAGPELLVVGDGPVEIGFARQAGAVALGIAADEERGCGLDERKRRRLVAAGANLLVTDFLNAEALADLLAGTG